MRRAWPGRASAPATRSASSIPRAPSSSTPSSAACAWARCRCRSTPRSAWTPPLTATPIWLLPPDLRNPRQWLELITKIKATFTVSPDFGYRNCVRHTRDTSDLDLTTLKAALSGAEPVRPSTIQAFESHFGIKNVVCPCYGLAEATLAVAIWPRHTPPRLD